MKSKRNDFVKTAWMPREWGWWSTRATAGSLWRLPATCASAPSSRRAPPTNHVRYVRGLREYAPSRYAEMVKSHGGSPGGESEVLVTVAERPRLPADLGK